MKNLPILRHNPKPWFHMADGRNIVPVIDPTGNNILSAKKFIIVGKAFTGGTPVVAATGVSLVALFSMATTVGLVLAGLFLLVVGINAVEGMYGKEFRKKLNKEIGDAKKENKKTTA